MDFQSAVRTCFEKYVQFKGRAPRSEYWWWTLFVFIAMVVSHIIDNFVIAPLLGLPAGSIQDGAPLSSIFGLAFFLPNIAVAVRRLHDVNRSGFWLLIAFIPLLGGLLLLYWFVQPSDEGTTEYDA
ncbi:Inner membrane protein YhaI [Pseudovibrio axinellae]|uniref:Inner membrane protein YhaI n=1 Tax=Pseudovibrio axinellae TaxID=989403 RepID=A0A161X8J0_9HYPH|nr:DUF805 domain-containing protein [Pseudovibrio axinellae]KZL05451.1 Inner membrane protein YhaI [Pseudovibrio axinellae]SEP98653.1 Uncharacterized membrane protein YhaH, DUF805 family [Pseudovibrio axinellae]